MSLPSFTSILSPFSPKYSLFGIRRSTSFLKSLNYLNARNFSTEEPILVVSRDTIDQRVAVIKFNRPKKLNAFSLEMTEAFQNAAKILKQQQEEALKRESLNEDGRIGDMLPVLRGVVLTGSGNSFSAGGDLGFLKARVNDEPTNNVDIMLRFYQSFMCIRELNVPLYSAINGTAYGAGVGVALLCDFRIISDTARVSINFSKLGLHPGMGVSHYLKKNVSPQVYAYLCLTGDEITGKDAEKFGLAFKSVPEEQVLSETLNLARRISARASSHTFPFLKTLREQMDFDLSESLLRESKGQSISYASMEMKQSMKNPKVFSEDFVHYNIPDHTV